MLALAWCYRVDCIRVVVQQVLLVSMGLAGLGLVGLAIDVIRHAVDHGAAVPRWPWGVDMRPDWPPLATVAGIALAIVLVAFVQSSLRYHTAVVVARLSQRIVVQLRSDVYDKLQRLSFRFFDANASGSIINRVTGDVQAMRMFVDGVIIEVLTVVLSLAVYLAYMLSIHPGLTLASLATTPLLWIAAVTFSRLVKPAYLHNRVLSDQMILRLSENVQGQQVIKGFGRQQAEIEKFRAANRAVQNHKRTIFQKISLFQPGMGLLTQVNLAVLLGYGGYLVVAGELRLGEGLFVFANLLQEFANQVGQITNITNSVQASLTGAQRVFEVLDAPLEVTSPTMPARVKHGRGEVRFDRVSFGYAAGSGVLEEIDFAVRPGECVAIVGADRRRQEHARQPDSPVLRRSAGRVLDRRRRRAPDGSRRLAAPHWPGVPGKLLVQQHDRGQHRLRQSGGHASKQIESAARIAAAHDFISALPEGYDTVIGEYGAEPFGRTAAAAGSGPGNAAGSADPDSGRPDRGHRSADRA